MFFTSRIASLAGIAGMVFALTCAAQTAAPPATPPTTHYVAPPAFDLSSIDKGADPCNDFYKFACGNFAKNHPIPADQSANDLFYLLYNVNTQALNGILEKAAAGGASRTPNEQKVGDYYAACMDTKAIESKGLEPIQPLLNDIDNTGKMGLAELSGKLQRIGVGVFFGYGEMQDFKDATKQIAVVDQGGLGLPEKDYYLRDGDKDKTLREQYVAHVTKMLSFGGETPQQALRDANAILAFETTLAKASQGVADRRTPENIYHLETMPEFEKSLGRMRFTTFLDAIHSPHVEELNVTNPGYMPALIQAITTTDIETLRAYLRYQVLTAFAGRLPQRFDDENFDFYGRKLEGQQEQEPRWKRCSGAVDGALGEALGQVYVQQYFAGDAKAKTLEMVGDIEHAMDKDLDSLDWMSPETKVRAKEKLHAVANKIGYPDKWRDYSSLTVSPTDAVGDKERAAAFENDRQLAKIGKPVDKLEWGMTPPTVNAYYDPSMNNINFPAGILQPPFYDPKADDAVNYGHIGAVIGHELTHGFDDEGKKFGATGNLSDWWTPEDTKKFEARTGCIADEYGSFTAVDDIKVNGKLTLGENTADNGGLVLAFMAYMDRAKKEGVDLKKKIDGYTSPQRFYIAYAQNWCENSRDEAVRAQTLTNEHAPDHFRVDGVIVNQPAFGAVFGCKKGSPMVPADACRVW
ncbi:MAG TPA: M13 family metallopeptidase [Acidobacteriaceae bacterium]|nr:M13 family metallopeptidase [Acidobacteriaceae bacterium]